VSVGLVGVTIVHDILRPEKDRVRASGLNDDPAGGVLDGAPDRLVIVWRGGRELRESAEAAANLPRHRVPRYLLPTRPER
jgi:hypothetical protein